MSDKEVSHNILKSHLRWTSWDQTCV